MNNIFKIFKNIVTKFKKPQIEKIIVGLGNPLPKYENTRHNAGFKALDALAKHYNISLKKRKFLSIVGYGNIENVECLLMKPQTYMNNSGEAVQAAKEYHKLPIEDVIVLVDDISFIPGIIKIKQKGSAGTHNGLKSIIYNTDSENFCRIKIGVGQKPSKSYDLAKWVIGDFTEDEEKKMNIAYKKVLEAVGLIVTKNIQKAMNFYNKN